jgi:hypothetical protein
VARVRWDQNVESRILALADPQVQKAVSLFGEAAELADSGADGDPGRQPSANLRALAAATDKTEN